MWFETLQLRDIVANTSTLLQSIEEPPEVRRSRDHIAKILRLDEGAEVDMLRESTVSGVLKDVKRLVENSVRSLEGIFKYNDVSNRNFGGILTIDC